LKYSIFLFFFHEFITISAIEQCLINSRLNFFNFMSGNIG
jgi:hypothetical protein